MQEKDLLLVYEALLTIKSLLTEIADLRKENQTLKKLLK